MNGDFEEIYQKWDWETGFHSNPRKYIEHPDFLKMVELGESIVPLVLQKLNEGGSPFLTDLLKKITGEDPTPKSAYGRAGGFATRDHRLMIESWLEWGRNRGRFPKT